MRCLAFALCCAIAAGVAFTPLVGLLSGALLFMLCRLAPRRRQNDGPVDSSGRGDSTSASESSTWSGSGGLFGGAAGSWDAADSSGGDSGGGDGGGD